MGFSPRGTCVGSRYGPAGSLPTPFSWGPGIRGTLLTEGPSPLRPLLTVTVLRGLEGLGGRWPAPPTPIRQGWALRCRTYPRGRGILTPFPFGGYQLGPALGPAHSRLTTIAGKPWPFRRGGFSPPFAVTAAGICTCGGSSGPHGPPSAPPQRPPTW